MSKYKSAIENADKLLAVKSYDQGEIGLTNRRFPSSLLEQYPTQKIAEIDHVLAEMSRLKALD